MKRLILFTCILALTIQSCKKEEVCDTAPWSNTPAHIIGRWNVDRIKRYYTTNQGWQQQLLYKASVDFFSNGDGLLNMDSINSHEPFIWTYNEDSTYVYTFFNTHGYSLNNFKFRIKIDEANHQLWEHKEYTGPTDYEAIIQIWDMTK